MKKLLLLFFVFIMASVSFGQDVTTSPEQNSDLPSNPEAGKCYVRCKTPDIYKNVDTTFVIKPAYTKVVLHPAEYEKVTEKVLVKEASIKRVVHPAEWGTEQITYVSKAKSTKLSSKPAKFSPDSYAVKIKPESAYWVMGDKMPDCESSDPNDCRVWCYKKSPPVYEFYKVQQLDEDVTVEKTPIEEKSKSYSKKVITKKSWVEEIEVPAKYATITKTVVKKDAWVERIKVDAEYKTVTKEVLEKKGGLTQWRAVACELTEYSLIPINWNLNSATLTPNAKKIIDESLVPVLNDNPDVTIEIASHTDSRNTKSYNQNLSERRARAVVNYLISNGVNASRLVAKGYGESRLVNRCSDGVTCTEREHAQNRRTEFRIISQ